MKLTTNAGSLFPYASFICAAGKMKGATKTKRNSEGKRSVDKGGKEGGGRRGEDRLLCLLAWHVPGSHDVNQRTCLSRGRELFLGQVQRSIPRNMIDAPMACNGPRISPSRMRKLRDREKNLYKPIGLYRVSWNFRMFVFPAEEWLIEFDDEINSSREEIICFTNFSG